MSSENIIKIQNLKQEYITGTIDKNGNPSFKSLDALIKEYNIPASTIYRSSSLGNWKSQRKSYQDKTYKLHLSNAVAKNQMNEIITIILVKAKQMLVHKNLNSKDLLLLTQTIKMCKQNLND
jgi:hypothetical protein|tara:strand:+ start:41 stop:406 length:366 start_codon:yes stop_codon:yes gene_type:complete